MSRSKLVTIPPEILALIVQEVPEASLSSLALVNSDCRQLARSRQFRNVCLDYSNHSLAIILKLQEEKFERFSHNGLTHKPALGPCIRRLTVATHPGWIKLRHNIDISQEFNALSKTEQSKRLKEANDAFFGLYIPCIQDLLYNRTVLPHLELLDWEDRTPLQPHFFNSIANSAIQHIKLFRTPVDKVFTISAPQSQPSGSWPLQNLHLEIVPVMTNVDLDVSRLCTSLLQACAPSLRSLTWATCYQNQFHTDGIDPNTRFPSLRHLRLEFLRLADNCLLKVLVHDGLNSLDVDTHSTTACSQFFDRRGRIPALKTFVWDSTRLPESQSLEFLEANSQITKLGMPLALSETLLGERIFPLLVRSFSNLTSLSLVWRSLSIPPHAIEQISRITSLEQLHLSSGDQYGWRHDWLIDHEVMQKYLPNLPLLGKLAFSRDSYSNGFISKCDTYYGDGLRRFEDLLNENHTREMFEEDHRQWMLEIADGYIEKMARLKWIYFGQVPMVVKPCLERGRNVARPLTTYRDSCWSLLREMFGWKGLLPS